nr:MAG TPA: hypothetical protein [Bacteriophage sp.]
MSLQAIPIIYLYGSFLYMIKPIYSNHIYDTHFLFIFPILIENSSYQSTQSIQPTQSTQSSIIYSLT